MFRKLLTVGGTIGILVGGALLISFMGAMRPNIEPEDPEITPPTVFYTVAKPESVTLDVTAQGEVRPRTDINLTAEVSGRVISTSDGFVNGGAFEKGDLLIKIEDAAYSAAVAGARARVAQAEEALRREEAEGVLAERDYRDLNRGDDPSDLTLRKPQLAQARANFAAKRADLRSAQLDIERTNIKAPFKGRVRDRIVGVGQFVAPGAQLGRIFSTDVAEIRLPLSDADLAKLGIPIAFVETEENPGPPVRLSAVIAANLHEWEARIARTDGAIDPATRQISAIAVVDDPYGEGADGVTPLAIGLFVDATIEGKPIEAAFVVPRSALYGRDVVYVIGVGNILQERQVAVVSSDRDTITVASGINAGDRIVTSPLRGAGNGDEVAPEATAPVIAGVNFLMPVAAEEPVRETKTLAFEKLEPASFESAASLASSADVSQPDASPARPEIIVTQIAADKKAKQGDDGVARYKPGENAPNDEVASDLNRAQLEQAKQFLTLDKSDVADETAAQRKSVEITLPRVGD